MFSKITIHETGIETDHFPSDKLAFIDTEGLKRKHLTIYWKCSEDDIADIIRDLLKCQYMLDYKYLQPVSFKYLAQKSITNGDSNNIESSKITIEPLHNDFESLISRTPINQKLELNTNVILEKSISHDIDENGKGEERKYLSSNNLEFEGIKISNPCLKWVHYGAQEPGSAIHCKYIVQHVNKNIGKFRLFNFRRSPTDKLFVIQLWNFFGLSMAELIEMIIDYVKNQYVEPSVYSIGFNDKGANLLNPKKLIDFLEDLLKEVKKTKVEQSHIQDMLKMWIDAEK